MSKFAYVFPGQGSQSVGMGKESFEASESFKQSYSQVDEIFSAAHKDNSSLAVKTISEISFNGPEDQLARTIYTQPAILTLSIALAKELKDKISASILPAPSFVAGHSLGEFSALYMADVLSLEDTVRLVIKRAELMESAPAGAMAAVIGMEQTALEEMIAKKSELAVANYNSPEQIVITGAATAVDEIGAEIEKFAADNGKKIRFIKLNVGGAFHSPLMQQASDEFNKLIDECKFNDAQIPIVQNTSVKANTNAAEIKQNLKSQMTGSVRWTETVKFFFEQEVTEIYELGPAKVLAGLIKKQDRRFPVKNISSVAELEQLSAAAAA